MRLVDFTARARDPLTGQRYYRALVTWFKRAGLLDSSISYQQDIDLLVANFTHDLRRFEADHQGSSPPGSEAELREFLLWQLPQYSSFAEEGTPSRQMLTEVVQLTTSGEVEEAMAMLDPVGKCSIGLLRAQARSGKPARSSRYGDRA